MDIRAAIERLVSGEQLSESDVEDVVDQIMSGATTPAQVGAFLVALRMAGEQVEHLTGAARAMRRAATRVPTTRPVVDTCGTGGDRSGTFNISTAAALVAAGAGVTIAKHGNRAMSGTVGGADVLEALGVRIDLPPAGVAACLEEVGFAFLFAQAFHPAMRHVAGARRELGVRTIFNLLGPLANPAGATMHVLGVFAAAWLEPIAIALGRLGSQRALVVHGEDGLDEISLTGPTLVAELNDGEVTRYRFDVTSLGLEPCRAADLQGGDATANAEIIRAILAGTATRAQRDVALVNAAAAIYVAGKAADLGAGLLRARESIASGRARQGLERLVEVSNR